MSEAAQRSALAGSERLGRAKTLVIHEVTPRHCRPRGRREVEHDRRGDHSGEFAMAPIPETTRDRGAVFVARIGEVPADRLAAICVCPVAAYAHQGMARSPLDLAGRDGAGDSA